MSFVFIKKNISMSKHAREQVTVDYFFFFFPWCKSRNLFVFLPSLIGFVDIEDNRGRSIVLLCNLKKKTEPKKPQPNPKIQPKLWFIPNAVDFSVISSRLYFSVPI